jgi:L-threonylcarbamoyladenylate synthase
MKIVKINYKNPDSSVIKKAAGIIKKGGLVVVPTETVYGILADGTNEKTVKKLLRLKKRDKDKGFDLTLYPLERVFKCVEFNPLVSKILERFPEEPLSFALPRKDSLPAYLNPGFKTVAFHFFFSEIDKKLFKYIDLPLIGTSANISKLPDTHSVKKVAEYFRHTFGSSLEPDLILDAGKLSAGRKPSAIIELTEKSAKLIRAGDIPKEIMEKELKT